MIQRGWMELLAYTLDLVTPIGVCLRWKFILTLYSMGMVKAIAMDYVQSTSTR